MFQLFYADRVRFKSTSVQREFPIFRNWNTKKLKDREDDEMANGGFGLGSKRDAIPFPVPTQTPNAIQMLTPTPIASKGQTEQGQTENLQKHKKDLLQDAVDLASKLTQFVTRLRKSPVAIFGDEKFRKAMDTANRMIGCDIDEKLKDFDSQPSEKTSSQIDDEFWDNPEVIKGLEELAKALTTRDDYIEMDFDVPSFDLGFLLTPKETTYQDENMKMEDNEEEQEEEQEEEKEHENEAEVEQHDQEEQGNVLNNPVNILNVCETIIGIADHYEQEAQNQQKDKEQEEDKDEEGRRKKKNRNRRSKRNKKKQRREQQRKKKQINKKHPRKQRIK